MCKVWLLKTQVPITEIDVLMTLLPKIAGEIVYNFMAGVSGGYYVKEKQYEHDGFNIFGTFTRDSDFDRLHNRDSRINKYSYIEIKSVTEFLGVLAEYGRSKNE